MKLETELLLLSSAVAKRGEVEQHTKSLLFMWAQKERETLVFPGNEEKVLHSIGYEMHQKSLGVTVPHTLFPFVTQP